MNKLDHVMLDLETMGNGPTAAIVSIGAVKFDPLGPEPPCDMRGPTGFYERVSLFTSVRAGLAMDADTILWWLKQSEDARASITAEEGIPLSSALYGFSEWLGDARFVWGHGAGFDPVIITSAYKAAGRLMPFDFRNVRDTRTILGLVEAFIQAPVTWPDVGIKHHAWWDAWRQAVVVQHCYRTIAEAVWATP